MPDWSKIDLSAAIRRDYMTEGLNETLDLLERTAQSLRSRGRW
jgi:hypothetical protein